MKRLFTLVTGLMLVGCASTSHERGVVMPMAPGSPEMAELHTKAVPEKIDTDLNDNETDMQRLPADLNEKVTMWIEYFQGRGRPNMTKYLSRSSRYLPEMKAILKSHGLPEDLVYIAMIESGFSSRAYSRARAAGYWQFIGGTGRRYGLEQNYYVDERRDFIHSTEAAAQYLKALYNLFGSWYLAIASYNVGENRIKNLVMKYYTRDFWELAKHNRLPRETTNYVPKFLAARLIAKHPQKYGFDKVPWQAPLDFTEIPIENKGVDLKKLASQLNVKYQTLRDLNPSYKRGVIPKRSGVIKVRVPSTLNKESVVAALEKSTTKITLNTIASGAGTNYRIRRGDTLSHIARRFGTSIRALREANNLSRRSVLFPGKRLIIPGSGKTVAKRTKVSVKKGEKTYTVRSGDNLYNISKKFGVSLSKIKSRNKLGRRSLLKIGKVLVIPHEEGIAERAVNSVKENLVHVVRSGDTLYDIARRYNTTISALTKVNNLSRRASLSIGKKLVIP